MNGNYSSRLSAALVITAAAVLLVSCGSAKQNLALAKDAVTEFHSQLDLAQYSALYTASDEKLHNATTEADFTKLLEAVHTKLGMVRDSTLQGERVAWFAGEGATVTLAYDTKFSAGSGTEQFVWHITGGRAQLYGYHINSNDLITK